jgi:hypothetical protein
LSFGPEELMKKLLLLVLSLGTLMSTVTAAPLCTDAVQNAAQFQALGQVGCQFGDKIFYGFTYDYQMEDSSGKLVTSNVPASAVTVLFSNTGNLANMPVVSFLANWDVINGGQGDVRITYSVQAPVVNAMTEASLGLSGFVSNIDPANQFNSYISGAETICCPGAGASTVPLAGELDPPAGPVGLTFTTSYSSTNFSPATQIDISKDIFISSGSDSGVPGGPPNGNEATLTRIDQGLTELQVVPEPLSSLLFGGGLIGLATLAKRVGKFRR